MSDKPLAYDPVARRLEQRVAAAMIEADPDRSPDTWRLKLQLALTQAIWDTRIETLAECLAERRRADDRITQLSSR